MKILTNNIINKTIEEFIYDSTMEYYHEVNTNRAVADVRDGLKPIHRRIIYTMYKKGYFSSKKFVKSARVVGDTTIFHPHGTISIYESAVNMINRFDNIQPYIQGHGNFGSITGGTAAAERYTEMRLLPFTEKYILEGMNKNSVNMIDNFDESEKEPEVLPSALPMVLVNGLFGIGAGGISGNIPPHSAESVINLTIDYLKNPDKSVKDLIKDNDFYPKYPYGGILYVGDIEKTYSTGEGSMTLRSKMEKDYKNNIITITEIPFNVTLERIIENIVDVDTEQKKKKEKDPSFTPLIPGLKNIINATQRGEVELDLVFDKSVNLDVAEKMLFKNVKNLSYSVSVKMNLTNGGNVKLFNLKSILKEWLAFRKQTIRRIKTYSIKDHRSRIHIIDGLLKVLDPKNIDRLIKIVKTGEGKKAIVESISKEFGLTTIQATYVADMKLYTINNLEVDKLVEEKNKRTEIYESEMEYIKNSDKLEEYIIEELKSIMKDKDVLEPLKQTEITFTPFNNDIDDNKLFPKEDLTIITTSDGYIKKIDQKKSHDVNMKTGRVAKDDLVNGIYKINNKDYLLFAFHSDGTVENVDINNIPKLNNLNSFGERITTKDNTAQFRVISTKDIKEAELVVLTRGNMIKRIPNDEVMSIEIAKKVKIFNLTEEDDILLSAHFTNEDHRYLIASNSSGNSINVHLQDIPSKKIKHVGINLFSKNAINISEGKFITGSELLSTKDLDGEAVVVNHLGYAKRIEIISVMPKNLRTRGIKIMDTNYSNTKDKKVVSFDIIKDKRPYIIYFKKYKENEKIYYILKEGSNIKEINSDDIDLLKNPAKGKRIISDGIYRMNNIDTNI